jgi:hypothetical protein
VDGTTQPPSVVRDARGDDWGCEMGDVSHGEVVAEQGTFRFPFQTVGRAFARAEGTTAHGFRDGRRAGFGWTMLMPGELSGISSGEYSADSAERRTFRWNRDHQANADRILRSLSITFHTKDDDTDADTGLVVEIRSGDGRSRARFRQIRNKEDANVFTHTEQLQICGPVPATDIQEV